MPRSANGVAHLEKLELVEVPVMSVEHLDTMLPQEGREMGIRHQVAARGDVCGHLAINLPEAILLRQTPYVGQAQKYDAPQKLDT